MDLVYWEVEMTSRICNTPINPKSTLQVQTKLDRERSDQYSNSTIEAAFVDGLARSHDIIMVHR